MCVGKTKRQPGMTNGAKSWIVRGLKSPPSSLSPAKRGRDSGNPLHLPAFFLPLSAGESMKRSELEHLIRAAASIADDAEIVVIGSQAILGQFPNAPLSLLVS